MKGANDPILRGTVSELRLQLPSDVTPEEATLLLSIKLYEAGRISLGKAAELAGYSKRTFMELVSKQGVPVIDYPADDLARELEQ